MAFAKTVLFDERLQVSAKFFKALAHPARLAILKYLAETRVCISGDISNELPLSRTTINQHLMELKKTGLIKGTVHGAKTNYCLNPVVIKDMKSILDHFIDGLIIEEENNC